MDAIAQVCKELLDYGCGVRFVGNDDKCRYRVGGERIEFFFHFTSMDEIFFLLRDNTFSIHYNSYMNSVFRLPNIRLNGKFCLASYIKKLTTNRYVQQIEETNKDELFLITSLKKWHKAYKKGYTFENFVSRVGGKESVVYNFLIGEKYGLEIPTKDLNLLSFRMVYIHGNDKVFTYVTPFIFDEEDAEFSIAKFKEFKTIDDLLGSLPPSKEVTSYLRHKYIDEFLTSEAHV